MDRGVGVGALIGLVIIALLGWVPFFGPLVAGYTGGMQAGSRKRGASLGFAVGAIGSFILTLFFYIIPSTVFVITEGPLSGFVGNAFTYYYSLGPLVLIAVTVLCATLGGALGGLQSEKLSKQ